MMACSLQESARPGRDKLAGNRESHRAGRALFRSGEWLPATARDYTPMHKAVNTPLYKAFWGQFRELDLYMRPQVEDTLRRAIRDCGLSANELAKRTGVSQPAITRFLQGSDMLLSTASKIAAYLGLSLTKKP